MSTIKKNTVKVRRVRGYLEDKKCVKGGSGNLFRRFTIIFHHPTYILSTWARFFLIILPFLFSLSSFFFSLFFAFWKIFSFYPFYRLFSPYRLFPHNKKGGTDKTRNKKKILWKSKLSIFGSWNRQRIVFRFSFFGGLIVFRGFKHD